MAVNTIWHKRNPMPRSASWNQKMAWHHIHSKQCGCREIPERVLEEMRKRGVL